MQPDDVLALAGDSFFMKAINRVFARRGEELSRPPRITYVRFKPDTSCVLGLGVDDVPVGYVKFFLNGDATACVEKYASRAKGDGWVEAVPDQPAALFRFPLDRSVVGLPHVVEPQRLKHTLHAAVPEFSQSGQRVRAKRTRLQILRYKPERRGVIRADIQLRDERTGATSRRTLVVRAYADDRGETVATALRQLEDSIRATDAGLRVPHVLGYHSQRRIVIQPWCPGRSWLDHPDLKSGCIATARALRTLHELPIPPGLQPRDPFREARTVLTDLVAFGDPELATRAKEVSAGLVPPAGLNPAVVHGDLHYHQILLGDDDTPTFIDWDEVHVGDPREDAGNLLAHLHLLELDQRLPRSSARGLRESFRHESGGRPGLAPYVALHLAKLALVPFRNLRPDWRSETLRLLARADEVLARSEVAS